MRNRHQRRRRRGTEAGSTAVVLGGAWLALAVLWALNIASMMLAAYAPLLEPGPGAGTWLLAGTTVALATVTAGAARHQWGLI